jgi:membrane-bound acyltransferase YfiQ involved in biofilm formation
MIANYNNPIALYSEQSWWGGGGSNFLIDMFGLSYYFQTPTLSSVWWYMSLASALVFIIPIVWKANKKIGYLLIPLAVLVPRFLGMNEIAASDGTYGELNSFAWYMLTIVLGVLAAEKNLFFHLSNLEIVKNRFFTQTVKMIAAGSILCFLIVLRINRGYVAINDALITFILAYLVFDFIGKIPLIRNILIVIGKYSFEIYLIHAIIIGYAVSFLYSFGYDIFILLALLAISLIASIGIVVLRRFLRIDKLINKVCSKIK